MSTCYNVLKLANANDISGLVFFYLIYKPQWNIKFQKHYGFPLIYEIRHLISLIMADHNLGNIHKHIYFHLYYSLYTGILSGSLALIWYFTTFFSCFLYFVSSLFNRNHCSSKVYTRDIKLVIKIQDVDFTHVYNIFCTVYIHYQNLDLYFYDHDYCIRYVFIIK